MARIFIEGFESGRLTDCWEQDIGYLQDVSLVTASTMGLTGIYALEIKTGFSNRTGIRHIPALGSIAEIYFSFKVAIYPKATTPIANLCYFKDSGGTVIGTLIRKANGKVAVFRGTKAGTELAASTQDYSNAVSWLTLSVEGWYKPLDSNGRWTIKVDGTTVITINTNIDTTAGLENIDRFCLGCSTGDDGGTAETYTVYDDIVVDDAGWIGNSYIQKVVPTGVGATAAVWTPSTGANWECVDEIPASDTDYIKANVTGYVDTYGCNNLTGTIGSVKAVRVMARYAYEGTPTPTKQKIAILSGGNNYYGADLTPSLTYQNAEKLWELNPADNAAWEDADISALEIGMATVA
jgi:hypothetical protein